MTLYETFVEERVRAGEPLPGLYPASEASRAAFALWRASRGL
jgi:hypothetical protein